MEKRLFATFYRTYVERVYKFVYFRVSGNKEKAQDLTADVFLKAFEAFEKYDPAKGEASWIYAIARNHLINVHAKTRPQVDLEEIEGSFLASVDGRERLALRFDEEKMLAALEKLSEEDRKLIRMKYLEGWPFEDLAEIFEKTPGSLRVQAGRALKKMRELFKNPNAV